MSLYDRQIKLYQEMDAVVDLSRQAQAAISDHVTFYRQVSLLFTRIEVMDAMKDEQLDLLEHLESLETAARSTC